jgi:hypothetical protein
VVNFFRLPFDSAQGFAFDSAQGFAFDSAQGFAFDSAPFSATGGLRGVGSSSPDAFTR